MARATSSRRSVRKRSTGRARPDFQQIFYAPSRHFTSPKLSADMVKRFQKDLGITFPRAYLELLKYQNGGRLRLDGIFPEQRPPRSHTSRKIYQFESIAGLHPRHDRALNALTQLARKEWEVPEGLYPFDGDGHWWLCLDYRKCGPRGEPCITHFDTDDNRGVRIASSFEALLAGLIRASPNFKFALNSPAVRGKALDRLLRGIGCRTGRYKHPETWDWPRYRDEYGEEPAYLQVFSNTESQGEQDFLDLAPKHPILSVDVSPKDQRACIRELAAALGPDATLIHQPPDRKPVVLDNLPKVTVKPARIPKPPPFYPNEAHEALWNGDLAKVRDLLKRGMHPNRRHSADDRTPLELAATRGHTAMLKLMLKQARPPFRGDPLGAALAGGHIAAAKALIQAGAKLKPAHLNEAAMFLQPRSVRLLLQAGLRPSRSALSAMRKVELVSDDEQSLANMERDRRAIVRALEAAL